jgi:hypothetical protein
MKRVPGRASRPFAWGLLDQALSSRATLCPTIGAARDATAQLAADSGSRLTVASERAVGGYAFAAAADAFRRAVESACASRGKAVGRTTL